MMSDVVIIKECQEMFIAKKNNFSQQLEINKGFYRIKGIYNGTLKTLIWYKMWKILHFFWQVIISVSFSIAGYKQ